MTKQPERVRSENGVQHINPDSLPKNSAFTWAVSVSEPAKTIYIGGLNAIDASGAIVGKGDLGKQAEQVARNLQAVLEAAGAKPEHIIKWNVYILQGQSVQAAFEAFQKVWGQQPKPGVVTGLYVAGLAVPDALLEIDAVAVVPQG